MKHFTELNYYELLEIPPTATHSDIQRAYERTKKIYGEDSMATYSLFDDESRRQMIERIEEAFSVLSNENRRYQYNIQIGLKHVDPPPPSGSHPPQASGDASSSQAKDTTDLTHQEISGKLLQQLRKRQGIPLQEIADKTRITISYLQFIEEDHFKRLPPEVYLKGYVAQYAKMLGLDPDVVSERYILRYKDWKASKGMD